MQEVTHYSQGESPLSIFGREANEQVQQNTLASYQRLLTEATLRRHKADLALFQRYLQEKAQIVVGDLFLELQEWSEITWGMIHGFRDWMIDLGYAMGSVDVRVVTVKKYMRLAYEAGFVAQDDIVKLLNMKGHNEKTRRNIDQKRDVTRIGEKKATPTILSVSHLQALREKLMQDQSYLGRRDLLLLCLLGYHGLRCSEIHGLERANIDMTRGVITFYRQKVNVTDSHAMNAITLMAMYNYLQIIPQTQQALFLGVSRKGSAPTFLSTRAINDRVGYMGLLVGVEDLSPHDLRHACVDDAAKNGTPIELLKKLGGWKTYAMPEHYTRRADIANKGVKQSQW